MNRAGYEFRITLTKDRVMGEYDFPGGDRPVRMEPADIDNSQLATIKVLEEWLRRWEWIAQAEKDRFRLNDRRPLLVPNTFKALGEHLWAMALSEVPGEHLKEAIRAVQRGGRQGGGANVRVRLTFTKEASDLALLPWEFTHLAEPTNEFLAAQTDLTLGRYVADHDDRTTLFEPADDKLRILFVYNLPHGDAFILQRYEFRELLSELSPQRSYRTDPDADVDVPRVDVREIDRWDSKTVMHAMSDFRDGPDGGPVDVVHLVALFRTWEDQAEILLPPTHRDGEWHWGGAREVVNTLTADRANSPKLVVLHLAEWPDSDPRDVPGHFELLAPDLIRANVPAVLAMQYPMNLESSRTFLPELYRRLADGENIGAAVQDTRRKLVGSRDFGTSALYMQSLVDGNLVRRRAAEPLNSAGPASAISPPRVTPVVQERPQQQGMKSLLLDVFDELPVDQKRYGEMYDWVDGETWPNSTDDADAEEVKARLRLKRKAPDIDADADVILRRLLAKVTETQRHRGRDQGSTGAAGHSAVA